MHATRLLQELTGEDDLEWDDDDDYSEEQVTIKIEEKPQEPKQPKQVVQHYCDVCDIRYTGITVKQHLVSKKHMNIVVDQRMRQKRSIPKNQIQTIGTTLSNQVLTDSKILFKIFSFLHIRQLHSYRLVCSKWNEFFLQRDNTERLLENWMETNPLWDPTIQIPVRDIMSKALISTSLSQKLFLHRIETGQVSNMLSVKLFVSDILDTRWKDFCCAFSIFQGDMLDISFISTRRKREDVQELLEYVFTNVNKNRNIQSFSCSLDNQCNTDSNPLALLSGNENISELTISSSLLQHILRSSEAFVEERERKLHPHRFSLAENAIRTLTVNVSEVPITGVVGKLLFESLAENKNLSSLKILPPTSSRKYSDKKYFASEGLHKLLSNSRLRILDISGHKIKRLDLNFLENNQYLEDLRLNATNTSLHGVTRWRNCSLVRLDLSFCHCNVNDIDMSQFPERLQVLNLSNNSLSGAEKIFAKLNEYLPHLIVLDVSGNTFRSMEPVAEFVLATNTLRKFLFASGSVYKRSILNVLLTTKAFAENTSIIECDIGDRYALRGDCKELAFLSEYFKRNAQLNRRKTKSAAR